MTDDEHEFRVILSALDTAPLETPSYADELWADLDSAFDHATATSMSGVVPDHDDDIVTLSLDARDEEHRSSRPRRAAAVVLAAAVLVAVFVGLATRDTSTPDDRVSSDDTATIPVLVDPVAACARYHGTDPTLPDLGARLGSDQPVSVADIEATSTAIDLLASDFRAAGIDSSGPRNLETVAAQLGQAQIEVERGLLDQATRTVALALSTLTDALDPAETPLPASCAMPAP